MNLITATTKPSTRVIWTCKCGAKTHEYTATPHRSLERMVDGVMRDISYDAWCDRCNNYRKQNTVKGRVTGHVCNALCETATSGKCDCSCGGKNHGKAHAG